ncbi:hypothetical protein [Amycolatopsis sp. NPDC051071]|uniref:hypothetical protein n=1 Tax=Amycolatopsis sp. NPDC051071 TaxID=3154637 RepID=UPI003438A1E3
MKEKIFSTDNGKKFNLTLDAGYCMAMCLDLAKVILTRVAKGRRADGVSIGELEPGKWAIVQSAYLINSDMDRNKLISAQGLAVSATIPDTAVDAGDFGPPTRAVTGLAGTTVFSIFGPGAAHALLWHRDDAGKQFLYLDPNEGLWRFTTVGEARQHMEADLDGNYADLDEAYRASTVELG